MQVYRVIALHLCRVFVTSSLVSCAGHDESEMSCRPRCSHTYNNMLLRQYEYNDAGSRLVSASTPQHRQCQ